MEEPAAGGLPQWTGVYAAFDDVALAALANRGLSDRIFSGRRAFRGYAEKFPDPKKDSGYRRTRQSAAPGTGTDRGRLAARGVIDLSGTA